MPSTAPPKPHPRRTPSLTSLNNLSTNPPPISLWPTIFPPSGSLTPLLTSTNPKQRIDALTTVLTLLTPAKKFITAASNTPPSTTAFTTPATIALSTATALCNLLPTLLDDNHPIALAKTARLAAELSSCGIATPSVARKLSQIVLDESKDRTSRAAAASALVSSVCKADTDAICFTFSKSLSNPLVPVAEILAVLRVAVIQLPTRFSSIWKNASDVLIRVLSDAAVGLHAVRLAQGFLSALLENDKHHSLDAHTMDAQNGTYVEEDVHQLVPVVYDSILVPAATCDNQPMQLSAIAAIDAFQQLPITTVSDKLVNVHVTLRHLSKYAAIPVRSASLRALGNHPVQFEEILTFLVATPAKPTLPCAKAFSSAAVLLEKMVINADVLAVVEGFMQAAVCHINVSIGEMSKAEKTADEALRVACLAFLGVAVARLLECGNEEMEERGVENAIDAVMKTAGEGSVNIRVHACKSLARVLKDGVGHSQNDLVDFLCGLLSLHVPLRVMMASTRALLGMKDLSVLQSRQKLLIVHGCVTCAKAREGIGDTRTHALRQALRRLLGELVVRVVEDGIDWHDEAVGVSDLYNCVALYYRLPGFLKERFEQGDDDVLVEFPEDARFVLQRLLDMR